MGKTLYFNIEDDVQKIADKLKREAASELVLVFPKKSYIFSDGINLRLLKKQVDILGKHVSILTMDERGQEYARAAGFELKALGALKRSRPVADVRPAARRQEEQVKASEEPAPKRTTIVKKKVAPAAPTAYTNAHTKSHKAPVAVPQLRIQDTLFPDVSPISSVVHHAEPRTKARKSRSDYYRKTVVGVVALGLAALVLLMTVVLPSADVRVRAKADSLERDVEITVNSKAGGADPARLILPGTAFERTLESRGKFDSLGKKEVGAKAQGKVRIYNLTPQPLNLKAATTTLTVGDKKYYFTADQNGIKPITAQQAQSDPKSGQLADVVAADGGESYNLPGGTRFEIQNQVFGSKPQFLYARSEGAFVGGNSRFLSVLSQSDLDKAQAALVDGLVNQVRDELKKSGSVLADKAYTAEVVSFSTDKQIGSESPSFEAAIRIKLSGLTYNESGLRNLIRTRLAQILPQGKELEPEQADTLTVTVKSVDLVNGTGNLVVHYETKALSRVTMSDVRSIIAGKGKDEASELLSARPEIHTADISLFPPWQNSLPRWQSKINVTVEH